jgi:hypothetical protein
MPGGLGSIGQMNEEEELKMEHKMSSYIQQMAEEVKDRFKALKTLQDDIHELDDQEY